MPVAARALALPPAHDESEAGFVAEAAIITRKLPPANSGPARSSGGAPAGDDIPF